MGIPKLLLIEVGYVVQARNQGVGAGAGAHPLDRSDTITDTEFEHQSITGRPPMGELLHPPLLSLGYLPIW